MAVHAFNPCLGGRGRGISEFKASLVYRVSSRTARTTQRNPVLKNKNKQTKPNQKANTRVQFLPFQNIGQTLTTLIHNHKNKSKVFSETCPYYEALAGLKLCELGEP